MMIEHIGERTRQFLYPRGDLCMTICKDGDDAVFETLPQSYVRNLHIFFGNGREQQRTCKVMKIDHRTQDINRRFVERFFK